MSLRAWKWGWEQRITSTQKLVLLDLCDRVNDKAGEKDVCWPSQETIALRTGFTPRAVQSALKGLESIGLIKRKRRMIGGTRTSDRITLLIDRPEPGSSAAAPPSDSAPTPASPGVSPTESSSGGNQKDVPLTTGKTYPCNQQ
jgi:Helix-turn-helix domain